MQFVLATLPLILTLAAGFTLVATGILPRDKWGGVEVLSFRLLIPAVLITAISGADLSADAFGGYALALVGTILLASVVVLLLRLLLPRAVLPDPALTTLFQTTTRFNGFIALAAAELMLGGPGLALIAAAMAVMIPLINTLNIVVLATFGEGRASLGGILRTIALNPLVQGSAIGLALNLTGTTLPGPINDTLLLIGRAALGVGVLVVGAGISLKRLLRPNALVALGVALRLLLMPTLFLLLARALALPPAETLAGALAMSVPAATNGYIVARQMGGDAELYADILSWQSVLSMLVLPAVASFLAG